MSDKHTEFHASGLFVGWLAEQNAIPGLDLPRRRDGTCASAALAVR